MRVRALVVGLFLCAGISVGIPYGEFVIQGSRLGLSSSTPAALFLLFLLIAVIHPLLASLRPSWGFTRDELLLITVMMIVATAIPSRGFTGIAMAIISGVPYYASTENRWIDVLVPYLPRWIHPQGHQAAKDFYEGLPAGGQIPWHAWIEPLAWWLLFIGAFYCVLICTMTILRKQWMDHERLLYPLCQVPLSMLEEPEAHKGRLLFRPVLKNPMMWAGFAVPFLLNSYNALSFYLSYVPAIPLNASIPLARNTVNLPIRLNFLMMGLAYFINAGVAFSLWFFALLAKAQEAVCSILGIYSAEQLDEFSHMGATTGMLSHQTMGAMIVLVVAGLVMARKHLHQVWLNVWGVGPRTDKGELISYRSAAIGLVSGLTIMGYWLWRSGLPAWAVVVYLGATMVIFIALTRVIVEAGLTSAVEGMTACGFTLSGFGSSVLGGHGMAALSYTLAWNGDLLVFMMAPVANGIRLFRDMSQTKRWLVWSMAGAMAVALLGSIYTTLVLGYKFGALNLHRQYFNGFANMPFNLATRLIENPTGPHWPGWGWTGLGAAIMGGLMYTRHHLMWWPLQPIGYVASGTWIMDNVWFSIFLAWVIKTVVLRLTGPPGYRATRWFFLGIVLGQIVSGGLWLIIDGFTGVKGHRIRMY
jgi:hypothetical protein